MNKEPFYCPACGHQLDILIESNLVCIACEPCGITEVRSASMIAEEKRSLDAIIEHVLISFCDHTIRARTRLSYF